MVATKKQKREAAVLKRAQFDAEQKANGLAAQRADHARSKARSEEIAITVNKVNQRLRRTLAANGVDPDTGLLFLDGRMDFDLDEGHALHWVVVPQRTNGLDLDEGHALIRAGGFFRR